MPETEAERYRVFFASLHEGILVIDGEGQALAFNPAAESILGLTHDQLLGRAPFHPRWEVLYEDGSPWPPEDYPGPMTVRTGLPLENLVQGVRHASGDLRWLLVNSRPLRDEVTGSVSRALVSFQDITARERARRQLVTQYAVVRALAEADTVANVAQHAVGEVCAQTGWDVGAVWTRTPDGTFLQMTALWKRDGIELDAFEDVCRDSVFARGEGLVGLVWEGDAPCFVPDIARDPRLPRAPFALAAGLRAAYALPIHAGGELAGVLEFFSRSLHPPDQDLLELVQAVGAQIGLVIRRRQAELALLHGEGRLRAVMDAVLDVIFTTDGNGTILSINSAVERVLGWAPGYLVGRPVTVLLSGANLGTPGIRRATARRPSGSEVPVLLTVSHLYTEGATLFAATLQDLSEAQEGEEDLDREVRSRTARLRELSSRQRTRQEDERARVAHEIHDVVAPRLGAVVADLDALAAGAAETGTLRTATARLGDVIGTLERLAADLRPDTLDRAGLASAVATESAQFAERTGIACVANQVEDLAELTPGVACSLFRALQELLANVDRHAQASRVTLRLERAGDGVLLEVADDGRGMAPEQAHADTALGLLGIRESMAALGGSVLVTRGRPRGTVVSLRVPLDR